MSSKTIRNSAAAIIVVGVAGYLSLRAESVQRALNGVSHTLSSYCGINNTIAAQDGDAPACADGPGCNISIGDKSGDEYTANERKVINYICDQIVAGKGIAFTEKEVEKATGVSLEGTTEARLRNGVLAELEHRNFDFSRLACASNCTKFSACSIDRDLSGATGEELERYTQEKSQDGMAFANWYAPDFTLPTTAGQRVRLSAHRGKPVALVFLSGHCNHSHDTLPILAELKTKYQSRGLVLLPVFVNSGSVEDLNSWTPELNLGYDLLVSEDKAISKAYDSRMVPSTFLIDREGRITKKLVGYKDKSTLDQAFGELVGL
ncbi:TlpA family protein disulfide reductase [candidate division KSB1 bacterium]|nr:TlpA family protein disulfide reductase [candidate division KSB1 bacterium]